MNEELRIQELVEEALSSARTPEEVCRGCPELVPHVRRRLALVRELDAELDALLPDGERLADETVDAELPVVPGYEVTGVLGRGGMGVVYRARHSRLDRDVAVKMLLAGELASPRDIERFSLEARAIAKLNHPNIVQVYDVSERQGRPFFTMELVEGGTLAAWLGGAPQPAETAARIVDCLARAVQVAHESGIVHRDLKPSNVLLTSDGVPKVTDFGLARHLAGGSDLTLSGTIVGTPSYMAPEQIRGCAVGSGADVYALGAILYEMLTGRPPFRSDSPVATQMQVLTKEPVRPSLLNGRVPRDLETICVRCLDKEPGRRFGSAAELAADLRRFLAHEPIRARPVGRLERGLLWCRRNPAKAAGLSLSLVLLGASIASVVQRQALAREQHAQEAVWSPRIDEALERLRRGDLDEARFVLDQAPETLGDALRQRVGRARGELRLVQELDGIRSRRLAIMEGRFDQGESRSAADVAYEAAFRAAGLGSVGDDAEDVAARVRASAVGPALVGALDDWTFCAGDGPRVAWLLDVAGRADPDASPWRERLRGHTTGFDESTLAELDEAIRAGRVTVQLLVGAAERLREMDLDVLPLLSLVQRAHPDDFWANFALADVRWQRPTEALRYAQAALAIRPRSALAHQAVGIALAAAGRADEAVAAYRQALLVEPGFAQVHGRIARTLQVAGEDDAAIAEYREAIRIDPDLAWTRLNLAVLLAGKEHYHEAIDELRESLRLEPRSAIAHRNLGLCLSRSGRDRDAVAALERAVALEPVPESHTELGKCLSRLERVEEAEAELRKALALAPEHDDAKLALCALLASTARGEEALAVFRAVIARRPQDPAAWIGLPEMCAYLGRDADALDACAELLERFRDLAEPRDCERIGRACLLLPPGSVAAAAALIDRALVSQRSPPWLRPYVELAKALAEYRGGRFESALELLRRDAGRVLPPVPQLLRAMALQRAGAAPEARQELASAALVLDWSPGATSNPELWIPHILRREAEGLVFPEMAELLAGRLEPPDDDARAVMASACASSARFAAAARLLEQVFRGEGADRSRRHLAARTLARAATGLGLDPAAAAERARFRGVLLAWVRADAAASEELLRTDTAERRASASRILNPWLDDPAFESLRDPAAMERLPPAEREDWRAAWLEVEGLIARADGGR